MASQVDRDLIVAVGSSTQDAENLVEIRGLLRNGATGDYVFEDDPSIPGDLEGYNALMVAARNGRRDVVELLLQAGADPGVTGEDFYPQMGPVHCAAKSGHPGCLTLLLDATKQDGKPAADLNLAEGEGGNTALHMAVGAALVWNDRLGDFEECVTLLSSAKGIDLDCQNMKGNTALHLATKAGNTVVITTLLKAGARADIPNRDGQVVAYRLLEKLPHLLTTAFDASIRLNNFGLDDDKLVMSLDFGILVAHQQRKALPGSEAGAKGKDNKDIGIEGEASKDGSSWESWFGYEEESRETEFVECLAQSKSFELLCHPLLQAFLDVKWHVSRKWHHGGTLAYACAAMLYVVWLIWLTLRIDDDPPAHHTSGFTRVVNAASFGIPLLLKLIARLIINRRSILACLEFEFFLEAAFVFCQAILIFKNTRDSTLNVAAVGFILVVFRIACLFSHLPNHSLGLHLSVMLQVGRKMAVLVPIFLVVFIAFGLSFDVLFSEAPEKPSDGPGDEGSSDQPTPSKTPENIFKWVMQTLVMSTGEMNYNDLKFTAWVARLVFVVFVFVGHLLLMNALIGFAVNDTTEVHKLAAAHCARKRAVAVANVEKALCWTASEFVVGQDGGLQGLQPVGTLQTIQICIRRIGRGIGSIFTPVFVRPQLAGVEETSGAGGGNAVTPASNGKANGKTEKTTPMIASSADGDKNKIHIQKCVLACHPNARHSDKGLARAVSKSVVNEAVSIAHEARTKKAHRSQE